MSVNFQDLEAGIYKPTSWNTGQIIIIYYYYYYYYNKQITTQK